MTNIRTKVRITEIGPDDMYYQAEERRIMPEGEIGREGWIDEQTEFNDGYFSGPVYERWNSVGEVRYYLQFNYELA
jgi:hypothetical protein